MSRSTPRVVGWSPVPNAIAGLDDHGRAPVPSRPRATAARPSARPRSCARIRSRQATLQSTAGITRRLDGGARVGRPDRALDRGRRRRPPRDASPAGPPPRAAPCAPASNIAALTSVASGGVRRTHGHPRPHGRTAHAPSASFIFAQNPLLRITGTGECTFASSSITRFSSARELARRPDLHAHVQVAGARRIHARQPAPAQLEHLPALRARRDVQHDRPRDPRHLDVRAAHRLRKGQQRFRIEVLAVALEPLVLARRRTARRDRRADRRARPRCPRRAGACTGPSRPRRARRSGSCARPAAAPRRGTTCTATRSSRPRRRTSGTAPRSRTGRRTSAASAAPRPARRTSCSARASSPAPRPPPPQRSHGSSSLILISFVTPVATSASVSRRSILTSAPALGPVCCRCDPTAEQVAEPEVAHEDVERLGHVDMVESAATAAAAQPRLAVPIVRGALLRIAQHVVRLGDRLEALFGFLGAGVLVRMELHREATIGLLDVVVRRRALHAENLCRNQPCGSVDGYVEGVTR